MEKKLEEKEKISIAEIKADFEAEGEMFDDSEIEKIRGFLYLLAQISYEQYNRNKQVSETTNGKIININSNSDESTKSNTLYPCEYGRTG
ncbi:MAG: hypothetical protein J0L54_11515 [Chitinophagales bacterium]|jgi:hypothetical protein|nr:hypothetical protein [Chitinophagales bacterium]